MKRNEGNIGESDKTSVKVHHAPGGQSNFSLGWGNDQAPQQAPKSTSSIDLAKYHNQSSIVFGDDKPAPQTKNEPKPVEVPKEAPKVEAPKAQQQAPVANQQQQTQAQNQPAKTSVKVHNPPGGKSSITFG